MSRQSYLLVLLGLIASNIYMADSYALTASVLNQLGYTNQSTTIEIEDNNIDSVHANAFNGYIMLNDLRITSEHSNMTKIDIESFREAVNLNYLSLDFPSLNKFTNSRNLILRSVLTLQLISNLTSLNKPMFNAFPSLQKFCTLKSSNNNDFSGNLKAVDVHTFESLSNLTLLDLQWCSITSFEYLQIPKT
jgi:hypothetical protein